MLYTNAMVPHFSKAKRRAKASVSKMVPEKWSYKIKTSPIGQWDRVNQRYSGHKISWSVEFIHNNHEICGHFNWSPCLDNFSLEKFHWQIRGWQGDYVPPGSSKITSEEATRLMWGDFHVVKRCVEIIVKEMDPANFGG